MIKQVLMEEGRLEGCREGHLSLLSRLCMKKYRISSDEMEILEGLRSEDLLELGEFMLDCDSFSDIEKWVRRRKLSNMS